jgi:protein-disulfide isomerase
MNTKLPKQYRTALLFVAEMLALAFPIIAVGQNSQLITATLQEHILRDPGTPALGSVKADVTIVEYLDYNCPFCRKLAPDLQTLAAADHGVAVIYKDWPIFGGVSVYAARSALAAQWQGKYLPAHDALISGPRLAQNDQVDAALRRAGIDMARLKLDMTAHRAAIDALLARNDAEAHELKLRGTPGILVRRMIVPDIADLQELQAAVAYARRQP